jgi:hypothetical protein
MENPQSILWRKLRAIQRRCPRPRNSQRAEPKNPDRVGRSVLTVLAPWTPIRCAPMCAIWPGVSLRAAGPHQRVAGAGVGIYGVGARHAARCLPTGLSRIWHSVSVSHPMSVQVPFTQTYIALLGSF